MDSVMMVRIGNAALGGLVGAYLGVMMGGGGLLTSAAVGVGAATGAAFRPLGLLGGQMNTAGYAGTAEDQYNYKEALLAGALFYVATMMNLPPQEYVRGAVAGGLACVILTGTGQKNNIK